MTFVCFSLIILGAIITLAPGWGFMDDHTNMRMARGFWQDPSLDRLDRAVMSDTNQGRFRPLYTLWILGIYKLAEKTPTLIYLFITALGLFLLPLWGVTFDKTFNKGRGSPFFIWAYPLAFFIFLPFWNNFMYISIQEKFLYIFGTPAVFFFLKAYDKGRAREMILAFLWALCATLGKETGIIFIMAFGAYAFTDLLVFRRRPKLSIATSATALAAFIGYYFFIKQLLKNYTAKYADNTSLAGLAHQFQNAPLFIKGLLFLSIGILCGHIIRKYREPRSFCPTSTPGVPQARTSDARFFLKKGASPERNDSPGTLYSHAEKPGHETTENGGSLFAWLAVLYILLLLPWGYPTYILAPLAVFMIGACLPLFCAGDRSAVWQKVKRAGLLLCALLAVVFFVLPNIRKMADKRAIIEKINEVRILEPGAVFFYPAPYSETADAIRAFTNGSLTYLADNRLDDASLSANTKNYLLMNDECSAVTLVNVSPAVIVYKSSTWQIIRLGPGAKTQTGFKPGFPENPVQKIKTFIKRL